jgi:hypothetical protein
MELLKDTYYIDWFGNHERPFRTPVTATATCNWSRTPRVIPRLFWITAATFGNLRRYIASNAISMSATPSLACIWKGVAGNKKKEIHQDSPGDPFTVIINPTGTITPGVVTEGGAA